LRLLEQDDAQAMLDEREGRHESANPGASNDNRAGSSH
jgi:hypothetical protein